MKNGWRWAAALVVTGALWTGCTQHNPDESEQGSPGLDTPPTPGDTERQPAPPADAGTDAGTGDPGQTSPPPLPSPDAGTPPADAGTPPTDAGTPPDATITFPTTPGWQFYGTQDGGPRRIYDVATDEGGNLWVAGGEDGLFLLAPGATTMRRLTMTEGLRPYGYMKDGSAPQGAAYLKVISVAGGPAGTVFVGYEGKPGTGSQYCESNWDSTDRKSTRLNSSHSGESRMPSSA